jgi:hypothetical protein
MSDAFNHNEYMFWNPFMSGSYPIHSDMQAPVWNPIVIIFSWLFDYNSSLLSTELFFYYLIGALGCFIFAKNFTTNIYSRFIIAISYGCGGFATSTMEFMGWIASFAFLPWAIHYFYRILKNGTYITSLKLAITLWLLMTSGYPSFLIFLGYTFAGTFICYSYLLYFQKRRLQILRITKYLIIGFSFFIVFSLPAIHSFLEYLPSYARGDKATLSQLNSESFSFNYPLSFIFIGGDTYRDYSMYIGLIPFFLLFNMELKKGNFTLRNNFLLIGCLFIFLFTLGRSTPFRMWCADYLPLLGKFGFSHSVRIFLLFPIYILIAPHLDNLLSIQRKSSQIKKIRTASMASIVILLFYLVIELNQIKFRTELIKFLYYISAAWQLLLLSFLFYSSKIYSSALKICLITTLDLIISVFLVAPLTGLSKTPNAVYNRFASDFYQASTNDFLLFPQTRKKSSLKIDPRTEVNALKVIPRNDFPSNTRLEGLWNFIQDSSNFNFLFSKPFLFPENEVKIEIKNFTLGYNFINADVFAKDSTYIIIQQTFHPRWRSMNKENTITNYKGIFLKVKLNAGENKLRLYYYKKELIIEYIISLSVLIFSLLFILYNQYKKSILKKYNSKII